MPLMSQIQRAWLSHRLCSRSCDQETPRTFTAYQKPLIHAFPSSHTKKSLSEGILHSLTPCFIYLDIETIVLTKEEPAFVNGHSIHLHEHIIKHAACKHLIASVHGIHLDTHLLGARGKEKVDLSIFPSFSLKFLWNNNRTLSTG